MHKHRRRRADAEDGSSMRCSHVAAMGVGCSTASLADCICDAIGFIVGMLWVLAFTVDWNTGVDPS